jgi:hypothetical protein
LHLPEHVRRFGPAILFETEIFESYNAIIRSWSIHSNRQAPSRDIANASARFKTIRHLASGGYFDNSRHATASHSDAAPHREDWMSIGEGPRELIEHGTVVAQKLGLSRKPNPIPGTCTMAHISATHANMIQVWLSNPKVYNGRTQRYISRTCTHLYWLQMCEVGQRSPLAMAIFFYAVILQSHMTSKANLQLFKSKRY